MSPGYGMTMLKLLLLAVGVALATQSVPLKDGFPDRNGRQRHLHRFIAPSAEKGMRPKDGKAGVHKAVRVLFWNDVAELTGNDKDWLDVLYTADCPVPCQVSMRRGELEDAHVVVYNDLVDKRSRGLMADWQRTVILALSPVAYFVEREMQAADALATFGVGTFAVDYSFGGMMLGNVSQEWRGDFVEDDINGLWRRHHLFDADPATRIDDRVAVFWEDCESFEGGKGRQFVLDLQALGVPIDLHGSCFSKHNPLPMRHEPQKLIHLMRQYSAVLVVENARIDDYVTERIYQALAAGAVPIYLGAPNVRDLIDPNAIIDLGRAEDLKQAAATIKNLLSEKSFSSYKQWERDQVVPFNTHNMLFKRGPNSLPCQVCQWYRNNQ